MLFSCAFSIFAQDMNVARAVARALPVRRDILPDLRFGFFAEKCKITVLIIYAPESARAVARARPVRRENLLDFVPVFIG